MVYAKLYENFPLKINLSPSSLATELDDALWSESRTQIENGVTIINRNKSPVAISKPTIEWLANAGLISYERYDGIDFVGVCLTAKGLESIEANNSGESLLNAVKDLAKDQFKEQAKVQLNSLFSKALSWSVQKVPTIIQNVSSLTQ